MKKLRDATLVFLVERKNNKVVRLCLAMKKRGFGANRWNGVGGKVNADQQERVEDAARREAEEEISVRTRALEKVAELSFFFPHNPAWDQLVHVYLSDAWGGTPTETEEMTPCWFNAAALPFDAMWPDDRFWIPKVLEGHRVKASFRFGEGDVVKQQSVEVVEDFTPTDAPVVQ